MATYIFAKLGKSIKFNPKSWSAIGGDVEAPSLIRGFAQNNPNDKILILGKNDLERYEIPEKNIYSVEKLIKEKTKKNKIEYYEYYDFLKDKKIDGVFIIGGPTGSTNIPNKCYTIDYINNRKGKPEYTNILEVYRNYSAHIIHFLNESKIPWFHILNDPRYKKMGRDCINVPKLVLSQYNEKVKYRHINNFEEQKIIEEYVNAIYSKIETMFLIHHKNFNFNINLLKNNLNDFLKTKNKKFTIILNEGKNGVPSRYPKLKQFVLDYFDDIEIYGSWDKKTIGNDKRFKGSIPYLDLHKMLPDIKYTFIIPILDGWVTMKYWEMILNGIIPFMHPEYDSQNNLKAPEFLRVKSGKELKEKIDYLENNPKEYQKLLIELTNQITDDMFSGKELSNILKENIEKFKNEYDKYNKNKIELKIENKKTMQSLF